MSVLTALNIDKEMIRLAASLSGSRIKSSSLAQNTMAAIRKNPNLRSLFRMNYIFGIWIPENLSDWRKGWKFKAWEIVAPISALISLYLIMKLLILTMVNYRAASLCQPVITFLIYMPVLAKNAYILLKKNSLIELFKTMEKIVTYHPFKHRQKPFIAIICKETKKTLLLLTFICTVCYFIMIVIFGRFDAKIKAKIAENSSTPLTDDERVTSEIIRAGTWTEDDYIVLIINSIFAGILPIKNIVMDCLMFLCHNFVVHELQLLQQTFSELDTKKIAFVNKLGVISEHDHWITMFRKIRKYVLCIMISMFVLTL